MTTFESGAAVKSGYYLNPIRWQIVPIANDGAALPEGKGTWMKVATPVALALVPILGATFLMAMPAIGFVVFAHALALRLTGHVARGAAELASTVAPGQFAAGEAYLTGKPGEEKSAEGEAHEELEKLAREIEEKKNQK